MLAAESPQEVASRHRAAVITTRVVAVPQPRYAGLDGLRALAVVAVVLFHADFYWARGGYLGVDLFFVISGFLITRLIAREVETSGHFALGSFYWRRAKRLFPAVWLMTAVVVLVAACIARDALPHLHNDAIASFLYVTNWELLRSQTSYFEAIGRPPLLQHLWSLAVEEQFYIAWAPLAYLVLPRLGRRGLALLAGALAVASIAWMIVLAQRMGYPGQGDPSRLYFGTDTHGFVLLLGAAFGLLWRQPTQPARPGIPARLLGWLLGLLALAAMVALFATMGENLAWLYPWGFLATSAAAIVLIGVATHPGLAFGRCLDIAPLRWLGERSYGIYLWHWPVFMLTRPGIDLRGLGHGEALALGIAITLLVAELSYRWLEMPIRRGALERLFANHARHAWSRQLAAGLVLSLLVGSAGATLWQAPTRARPAMDVREAVLGDAATVALPLSARPMPAPAASALAPLAPVVLAPATTAPAPATPDQPSVTRYDGNELTAVGDSVLLGSSRLLKATLPGVDVHATMGWQAADVIRQLKALKQADALREVTLVHLGTNGYVTEDQLRQILTLLADCKRVILVNTHVPRRWMEANNELIDRVAPDFPNVVVVRWNDLSENHPDDFVSDGVHLTPIGQRAFIGGIMRAGHLARDPASVAATDVVAASPASIPETSSSTAGDLSPSLVLLPQAAASDRYWHEMARCETNANWQDQTRPRGGLDITVDDWKSWGGEAYAPTPSQATVAQQIDVANRIATQGWARPDGSVVKPIGYARWRCVAALGRPASDTGYTYTPASVLAQTFHLGERGDVVRDLQRLLGQTPDGIYSRRLHRKHLAYLKKNGLPASRAGTPS